MSVEEEVAAALLGNQGELGMLLQAVQRLEAGGCREALEVLAELDLAPEDLRHAQIDACAGVQNLSATGA